MQNNAINDGTGDRSETFPSDTNCSDQEDDPFINRLWGIHKSLNVLRGTMSKQQLNEAGDFTGEISDYDETSLPPTYMVLQTAANIPEATIIWLISKIRGKRRDGAGELIVMREPTSSENITLHISASKIKLLEIAEEIELIKENKYGQLVEFTVAQLDDFLLEGMHVDDLLTLAERQGIVRHVLENIRALEEDRNVPGYPASVLYAGQSIIQVCLRDEIVMKIYPLHDEEALKKLGHDWYLSPHKKQPIEDVRLYFGESIALYFGFLGFYTSALVVPVLLGLIQLLVSVETVPFFCVFNVVWVTLFLEIWRRKSNELAFKWGTIGMTSMDEPRPNFRGSMGIDAVTGKVQPQSPRYMTYVKMYGVSIPIVLICMLLAFYIMLLSFWAEDYIKQCDGSYEQYIIIPSVLYSVVVYIVSAYYRKLATHLTEWENHRTQSQFERHRVTKLVLFEFVNNFLSLFYIAFIIRDLDMLRSQLQTMLIISQAIYNFQEAVLPLALKYFSTKMNVLKHKIKTTPNTKHPKIFRSEKVSEKRSVLDDLGIPTIQPTDTRIEQAAIEGEMDEYQDTFDDYLELFIQFGYVFLFSSVYPAAAFWAILNNVLEIRADGFKLCKLFQRPMSRRVKDIGAWQRAFEVMGGLSIMTNCGVLYLSPQIRDNLSFLSDTEWILLFVFLEHILLGVRYLLHIAISDKPEWVRVALAKKNYESKQALKFERSQRNKRLLTRRYKTVHGKPST